MRLAKSTALFCFLSVASLASHAKMPTNPEQDKSFLVLDDGRDLSKISVKGTPLFLTRGSNLAFGTSEQSLFLSLVKDSKTIKAHPVQWALMDLDTHTLIDASLGADLKVFGASSSKVFVGATLVDQRNAQLTNSQLQLMSDMLVVSSNEAWVELQSQIGGGNPDKGREHNYQFTQRMGYGKTRGWQGYWGQLHGNELVARETVEFLYDTYQGNYPGAEFVWKLMHTYRTGANRGNRYLPQNVLVGGKTGTYDGPSVDPETGKDKNPDGTPYTVKIRNQILVFRAKNHQYGLVVLANDGKDNSAALLAGGFYRKLQ